MAFCSLSVLFLFALDYVTAASPNDYYDVEKTVIRNILRDYQKLSAPRTNEGTPLKVNHSLTLNQFDLEEKRQLFSADVYQFTTWTDNRLTWDPKSLPVEVESLHIPSSKIWIPDFAVYNSATEERHLVNADAIVHSNGVVNHIPSYNFKANCKVNDHIEAGDHVICFLNIGSWTYDASNVDPVLTRDHVELGADGFVSRDWELVSTNGTKIVTRYPCCSTTPYASLKYYFHLKRTDHVN